MRRAMAVARKLGMKPIAAPAAVWAAQHYPAGVSWLKRAGRFLAGMARPAANRVVRLQSACHEYLGYVWYWALGRV